MIQDFITFETLKGYATLTVIVMLSTEYSKKLIDCYFDIRTEVIVLIYSFLLINLNIIATSSYGTNIREVVSTFILSLFNALVVGYSASASYSKIITNYDNKIKDQANNSEITVIQDTNRRNIRNNRRNSSKNIRRMK